MDTIRKSIFSIGLNDQHEKRQILSDGRAYEIITDALLRYYPDGATIYDARGIYRGQIEKTVRVEILFSDETRDALLIEELKKALNQECIAIETTDAAAALM